MKQRQPTGFFDNKRVHASEIVKGQRTACIDRVKERGEGIVLLVQDTTSFNFSHHPQVGGMGPLENKYMSGFLAHTTLAVSPIGVPFGLWDQQVWVRDATTTGKSKERHERPFIEKESYRWVEGLPELESIPADTQAVTVCDREAHIYEFFDAVLNTDTDFLVRASQGRSFMLDGTPVFAEVAQWPVQQHYTLHLKRRPDRKAREAQVELRYGTVTLKEPNRAQTQRQTLTIQVVEVIEPIPPEGQEAVHWLLLTSLPVTNLEQAHQMVEWYSYRWLIERFHYVLKSGCKLEARQLQAQPRLERLLSVFNLVAWRLLWLTYQTRQTPDASCLIALTDEEWQALYAHHHRTTQLPTAPPTLHQATLWIAQLGGFLARKSDGEPGVKVLWRGWMRLQDIVDTWRLFHPSSDVGNA
jgi:hypothetical protein